MSELRRMLEQVARGEISVENACAALTARAAGERTAGERAAGERAAGQRAAAVADFALVDHDRAQRCGFPEVVYCEGKEPAQAVAIAAEILTRAPRVLLTRASAAHADALCTRWPHAAHHARARCVVIDPTPLPRVGQVAVLAAGTSDLPVAEEAAVTAQTLGARVALFADVGVAGLHRLLARIPDVRQANAIVAVAGMEGALPSVVAGLVDRPVIGVPTSVGYGTGLQGLSALLAMLNSCAAGVSVVNVDNGFGAGYAAAAINRLAEGRA